MRLNHLDLLARDVQALAAFFVDHFDFTRLSNDRSPAVAILRDSGDFTLVVRKRDTDTPYPEGFHVGFYQPDVAAVHAHHARLTTAGLPVGPVEASGRGTMFYLHAPEGILVEVNAPGR